MIKSTTLTDTHFTCIQTPELDSQIDSGESGGYAGLHRPLSGYYGHADHACAAFAQPSKPGGSPVGCLSHTHQDLTCIPE